LAGGLGVLCLAFWLRLTNLYSLPIFVDEANHLIWAHLFAVGQPQYPLWMDGKFLLGILLAIFQPAGPTALWQGRAAEATLSLLSCSACIALGRQLHSARAGLLAGLLYALLPYAVFHDRQVLADSLMAHFGAVALVFTLHLARWRRWRDTWPLAGALAAAFAVKFTGAVYLFPVGLAGLLLNSFRTKWTLRARYLAAGALAVALVTVFFLGLRPFWGSSNPALLQQNVGFIGCPPLLCRGDWPRQLAEWQRAGAGVLDFVPPYFGWPVLALAMAAWLAQPRGRRRPIAVLGLTTLGFVLALLFVAKSMPRTSLAKGPCTQLVSASETAMLSGFPALISVPPRYYSFVSVPLVVLAALGAVGVAGVAARRWWRVNQAVLLGGLVFVALIPMANTALVVMAPAQAQLPRVDRWQYFVGPYAGPGFREIALALQAETALAGQPAAVLIQNTQEYVHTIGMAFSPARIAVSGVAGGEKAWTEALGRAWLTSPSVYLIDEIAPGKTACQMVSGLASSETVLYPRSDGLRQLRLQKVALPDAQLRARLFTTFFTPPEQIPEAYQALAAALSSTPAEETVVLAYPPNQLVALSPWLARSPSLRLYPIGDAWPLDRTSVERELASLTATAAHVKIVFLGEQQGDPQQYIENWLNTHLFRLDEQWFEPLRLVEFEGQGQVAQMMAPGVRFGEHIVLEQIQVMDAAGRPGSVIPLRLTWYTDAAIERPYKVFVHIFNDAGLVAQYDGQPQGGMRPTPTWQAGEQVIDQLAIRLPPDLAAGPYRLRVGLYDPDTLARLPAQLPDGTLAEFYVGEAIVIK
jgi:4-amino-4-deoxy-L-arabinose transferase-like glycosyltransferase